METRKYLFETLFKQFLTEQKDVNINQFDDLIGKSVMFKIKTSAKDVKIGYRKNDLAIQSTIKGIIDTIAPLPGNSAGVEIKLKTESLYQQHSLPNWKYDPADGAAGRIDYFCEDDKFYFQLTTDKSTTGMYDAFVPATCKDLYKILAQRYPCKTNLAMSTPTSIPNELT